MSIDEARQKYIGRMMVLRWNTELQPLASYERWARMHGIFEGDTCTVGNVCGSGSEFSLIVQFPGTGTLEILKRHLLLPEEIEQ